ncbi:MAG: phosphatidylinositol-specific phospholipase C domain-containing protein [Bacillales bacterium]|nr:phosphatidylinositol-specific phospholipase C domain-containing protein [Bacillales bacterium]
MKSKIKILISLGCVATLIGGFSIGIILNGTNFEKYKKTSYNDWMKYIEEDTNINDIVIPGSHDAGTYSMSWLGKTQSFSIKEQLQIGVRYFDIRVNKKSENDYVIFHSIINGVNFLPIIEDIKEFIINNPSETLLLDFQHFKNDSQEGVCSYIKQYLYDEELVVQNNTSLDDLSFISNLKLKDTRGKCIIFWGDRKMAESSNYLFARNNDTCSYGGMSLDSYYDSSFHKDLSSKEFIDTAIPFYIEKIKEKKEKEWNKGIFVLQTQLTDGKLIFGPWSKEKRHKDNVSNYIVNLKNSKDLAIINIIMRDFLNKEKSEEIIKLNMDKGLIDDNVKDKFIEIMR